MPERFLRKKDIAERLAVSIARARELLALRGVMPVDMGRGRGRGLRWLESDVDAVLRALAKEARPKEKHRAPRPPEMPDKPLHIMSANELAEYLASSNAVQ